MIETLLIDNANRKEVVPQNTLYQKDIDFSKLSLHLKMLPDAIKAVPLDGITVCEVTIVQTLFDVFNKQASFKMMLSEVHKLVLLYLTVPVTTVTAECSFSGLKRIKTYLRNSMTQQCLIIVYFGILIATKQILLIYQKLLPKSSNEMIEEYNILETHHHN